MKHLKKLCLSQTGEVFAELEKFHFFYNGEYAFRPGRYDYSPMVVCHADTVVSGGNGPHNFEVHGDRVQSIALDDRLGIASMLYLIEETDMADCAFLVCDDEEIGRSTAKVFAETNSPNWLVELDRRGTDVVCYEYDSTLLRSLLNHADFDVGEGSFSDICYLNDLGVCGFNVGVGYHAEHSQLCHAKLSDTYSQLAKLLNFYSLFGSIRLDYQPKRFESRFLDNIMYERYLNDEFGDSDYYDDEFIR